MIDDRRGEGRFWAIAAVAIALVAGLTIYEPTPRPLDASAPADAFSAGRARAVLSRVMQDASPHPTGSAANGVVRQRVMDEFRAIGLEPREEESLVCAERGNCALVRNIVAEIRGRADGPAVLVNAHHDSVAAAPGAGDDGAGLAALLETARAMKAGAPPERTVRFLVDDAEEAGLLGAEAWVDMHPREETLAVIVLEARGTSGPALLFETSRGNQPLVSAYARAVEAPATSSVYFSIYERLPNRTNFTVFKREGYTGFAAAFIENPWFYHTPHDDLENLSARSLQQMGDLTLSMARELSARGLETSSANASYFDLLGATVVAWPEAWNIPLSVAALVLVAITGIVAVRRGRASAVQIFLGWMVASAVVGVAAAVGFGLWKLAVARGGEASQWMARGEWLVVASWLVAGALVAAAYAFVRRVPSMLSLWIAVWLMGGIGGVVVARLLPGAAYLAFLPALAAGLLGVISLAGRRPERNEGMIFVPFVIGLFLSVPLIEGLYTGLGLIALPGIAALAAAQLLTLLVASVEARRPALLALACVIGAAACLVGFAFSAPFTADVPRGLNVVALYEPDGATSVILLGAADPMPDSLAGATEWSKREIDALRRPGANSAPRVWSATVDLPDIATLVLSESTYVADGERGVLRLVASGASPESTIRVRLPEGSRARSLAYGGQSHTFAEASDRLTLRGVPAEGFVLEAEVGGGPVEVIEERPGLSGGALAVAAARSDAELPIGPGDRTMIVSRLVPTELPAAIPLPEAPPANVP